MRFRPNLPVPVSNRAGTNPPALATTRSAQAHSLPQFDISDPAVLRPFPAGVQALFPLRQLSDYGRIRSYRQIQHQIKQASYGFCYSGNIGICSPVRLQGRIRRDFPATGSFGARAGPRLPICRGIFLGEIARK